MMQRASQPTDLKDFMRPGLLIRICSVSRKPNQTLGFSWSIGGQVFFDFFQRLKKVAPVFRLIQLNRSKILDCFWASAISKEFPARLFYFFQMDWLPQFMVKINKVIVVKLGLFDFWPTSLLRQVFELYSLDPPAKFSDLLRTLIEQDIALWRIRLQNWRFQFRK